MSKQANDPKYAKAMQFSHTLGPDAWASMSGPMHSVASKETVASATIDNALATIMKQIASRVSTDAVQFRMGEDVYIWVKTTTGTVVQPISDYNGRKRTGLFASNSDNIVRYDEDELATVLRSLVALTTYLIKKNILGSEQGIDDAINSLMFGKQRYYRNTPHALGNFYKALVAYATTGSKKANIAATESKAQFATKQSDTVEGTFLQAIDPKEHGGIIESAQAIKEDDRAHKKLLTLVTFYEDILPVVNFVTKL